MNSNSTNKDKDLERTLMTADSNDNFEYRPASAYERAEARRHHWAVAIGLQAVDGLEVSPYLRELAKGYQTGTYTLDQTGQLIRSHYAEYRSSTEGEQTNDSTMEADLVSQRIAELLTASPFVLDPEVLSQIHSYLFQDLDPDVYHPGQFKTERMIKQEEILNGDSVLYADPLAYEMSLRMYFNSEREKDYGVKLEDEALESFVRSLAFLWQIHPFWEGNTRTIAVFSELYLNHLGFRVNNTPFEEHSRYYREALVRAMYRNADAEISQDARYLIWFYDNLLNDAGHSLEREDLICSALFEDPTLLKNLSPEDALIK